MNHNLLPFSYLFFSVIENIKMDISVQFFSEIYVIYIELININETTETY